MMKNFSPSRKIMVLIVTAVVAVTVTGIHRYQSLKSKAVSTVDAGYDTSATASASAYSPFSTPGSILESLNRYNQSTSSDSESITSQVGKELFVTTAYLSQSGSLTDEMKARLNQTIAGKVANSFTYKKYDMSKLKVIRNPSKDEIKFYGNMFGGLQISTLASMKKYQKDIENDLSVLARIYEIQAESLSLIKVPETVREAHLAVINNYSLTAAAIKILADENKDPVLVPFAWRAYESTSGSQTVSLQNIANFLKSSGIIYSLDQPGGYWHVFDN